MSSSHPVLGLLEKETDSYEMGVSEDSFTGRATLVFLKPQNGQALSGAPHF